MTRSHRNARYGIDAPYVPALMAAGVLVCIAMALFTPFSGWWPTAVILAIGLALYLHTTWRGKLVVWRELLGAQAWRGSEQVLDLGCGRGAILLMAAAHVPHGQAVGVDIWSHKDQSGNAMDVTARNAEAEGVADRVELKTADMRKLPFADASFDLVVSNVAIHNISDRAGRERAIDEAWRVLRPGGRLLIADISNSRQYQQQLAALGADAKRRALGWRMWWGGPWMPTMLVTAQKPLKTGAAPDVIPDTSARRVDIRENPPPCRTSIWTAASPRGRDAATAGQVVHAIKSTMTAGLLAFLELLWIAVIF